MQEGKKQRIEFLDYLKAVCVIMVIITHYGWEDKTSPFFMMLINMAVPVFMIVSGYNSVSYTHLTLPTKSSV